MINYTSEYEGNFIIGDQPHIIDPINYNINELYISHPFLYATMTNLGLRFNEITFHNKSFKPYLECFFNYEYNYIMGTFGLEIELDKYFNKSIENGTCYKEYIKYPYGPNKFYYCNKEKYKNNIIYFPPLIFGHKELNYTFELDYKSLFIEKDDKLILMIFFSNYDGLNWYLGKPFLRKYLFLINQDSKTVGFYKRNITVKNNNKIIKTLYFILWFFILFMIGVVIGKYCFNAKKKHNRKNIIDYEYNQQNKNGEIFYPSKNAVLLKNIIK